MRAANLGVRFVLELCLLIGLAWTGWHLTGPLVVRLVLCFVLPIAAAVLWGRFVAPRARHRLADPARLVLEVVLFALGAVGLVATASVPSGVVMFAAYVVNVALAFAWHQRDR